MVDAKENVAVDAAFARFSLGPHPANGSGGRTRAPTARALPLRAPYRMSVRDHGPPVMGTIGPDGRRWVVCILGVALLMCRYFSFPSGTDAVGFGQETAMRIGTMTNRAGGRTRRGGRVCRPEY
jgi:hypothetical protein